MGNLKPMKPPVSNAKLIGEVLASVVATFAVGGGLGWTFFLAFSEFVHSDTVLWIVCLVSVFVIPSCIATITVYLIGRVGDQTGSFLITLGWSVLGGFLGIGIISITSTLPPDEMSSWVSSVRFALSLAPFPGAAIGAVIGFNWARRYKEGREPK